MSGRVARLFESSAFITALRLAGAGAGFCAQLLLARKLGAAELGLFYAVTSLVAVLGLVGAQGYPGVATRFLARYRDRLPLQRRFLRSAIASAAVGAAILAGALVAAAFLPLPFLDSLRLGLLMGAACLPFVVAINLAGEIAAAKRRFDIAYVFESLARPVLFLGAVLALVASGLAMSGAGVIALFFAITAFVALLQAVFARRLVPPGPVAPSAPRLARRWRGEARAAIIVALFLSAFADVAIVIAAPLMGKVDTAVFGLCLKLSFLVGFLVQAAHHVAGPEIAEARLLGDAARLRAAVVRAVMLPAAGTLLATLAALALGGFALSLFGADFAQGGPVLAILVAAQAVRALAGPSVTMLNLAGAQGRNAAFCVVALVALVLGSLALVPPFGAMGAAAAVLLAILVWQIAAAIALRRAGEAGTDAISLLLARRAAGTAASPVTAP